MDRCGSRIGHPASTVADDGDREDCEDKDDDVLQELLVEPTEIGSPGEYVARVVSKVYIKKELEGLADETWRI